MKTNFAIVLDDNQRRQVRAAFDRGGVATRSEIRIWAAAVFQKALEQLPPAKVRACNTSRRKGSLAAAGEAAAALEMALVCDNCGLTKGEHLGMLKRVCPVDKRVKPGSLFKVKR